MEVALAASGIAHQEPKRMIASPDRIALQEAAAREVDDLRMGVDPALELGQAGERLEVAIGQLLASGANLRVGVLPAGLL